MTTEQWVQVLQTHAKLVERCAWKCMDPEQFGDSMLQMLKEVGRFTVKIRRTDVALALKKSKLSLSSAECALFIEKLCGCVSHCKKRLRDAGSGVRLPKSYSVLLGVWRRHHGREATQKLLDDEKKKPSKAQAKKPNKDHEEKTTEKEDIRSIFGLEPKQTLQLDLISTSSGSSFLEEVLPSGEC